ncbi:hypothetical protein H4R35_007304 [Dimargaris xerosporica]|nr:hypothetical protein H4R35_007304 [Dimargaris xerosporica]
MTLATRPQVLGLYRSFLRAAKEFHSYNFREYVRRRARDGFKAHKGETQPEVIEQLIAEAKDQLTVAQRQARINALYSHNKVVLER